MTDRPMPPRFSYANPWLVLAIFLLLVYSLTALATLAGNAGL
jgi:hypothetical protein